MEVLLEPFGYGYMFNAMWVSALVGAVCAFLSCYLMLKGWSLIGDALSHAAQVLVQYSQTIAGFNQLTVDAEVAKSPEGLTIPADIYDTPIEELDLSTRTYNCLKRADITKVGQVLEMDEKALLSVRNLGQKSMEEIRDKLIERGYIPRASILQAPSNGTGIRAGTATALPGRPAREEGL